MVRFVDYASAPLDDWGLGVSAAALFGGLFTVIYSLWLWMVIGVGTGRSAYASWRIIK